MIYMAFESRRTGLNLWPDLVSGLSQSTVITGPLASGVCAWASSRWAAPAADRIRSASRSSASIRFAHAAETIGPVVAAFPAAVLVLAIYGMTTGAYGFPFIPWLLALWSCLLAAASFGYAFGMALGARWFTSVAAAIAFFALYLLSQSIGLPHGVRSLFPAVIDRDTAFARYLPESMWGQAVLFTAVSLLLITAADPARRRLTPPAGIAVAFLAVLAVGGGALVVHSNGQYLTGYNSRDFVCSGAQPEICLNRGYAAAHAPLHEEFARFEEKTRGTTLAPVLLEQNVEGIGDAPSPGARSVYLDGVDADGLRLSVFSYATKYGGQQACMDEGTPYQRILAVAIVDAWLAGFDEYGPGELEPTAPGAAEWARMSGVPVAEGNAWLRTHESEYLSCTLSLGDLP